MSLKSRARKIQQLTGIKYTSALLELKKRGAIIAKLRDMHPTMSMAEADAAICFENEEDLLSRWGGELFSGSTGTDRKYRRTTG